jgi:glutaminyl-peptide cyclotransferase
MLPLKWLWLPCLILLITGCTSCGGGQGAQAVVPAFDRDRAFADLVAQCDFGARVPGSQAHADCLAWLAGQLGGADQLIRQEFSASTVFGGPFDFTNLVAIFGQGQPGVPFLLCAHWDSRPRADEDPEPANRTQPVMGANDGASGVAVLLEMARAFVASPPPGRSSSPC